MLRKTSYFVRIPLNIGVWVRGDYSPRVVIKGPMCAVFVGLGQGIKARICEQDRLEWSRLIGVSKRTSANIKRENNNIARFLRNAFEWVCSREERHFKLVGRGYKVLVSRKSRCAHLVLGFAQRRIVPLAPQLNIKVKNRYNFSIVSTDRIALEEAAIRIQGLRPPDVYTARGILRDGEVIEVRPGKQTQY